MDRNVQRFLATATLFLAVSFLTLLFHRHAVSQTAYADFGDAPDSSNGVGVPMEAYPGVPARFPTVREGDAPYGPYYQQVGVRYFLGAAVSGETAADSGIDTDADGATNIAPRLDVANRDGGDDGLMLPDRLQHCETVVLQYTVTVTGTGGRPVTGYVNLWADWNRDGAWGSSGLGRCPADSTPVPEWAVTNQRVSFSGDGVYLRQTPPIRVWKPDYQTELWLRFSLSDAAAASSDGAGPATGYQFGEVEDYLYPGAIFHSYLPAVIGGGGDRPPPPEGVHVDPEFDPEVLAIWPQVPEGEEVAIVEPDKLILRLENNAESARTPEVHLLAVVNGEEFSPTLAALPTVQAGETVSIPVDYTTSPLFEAPLSPGVLTGEVLNRDPATGAVLSVTPLETLSFHLSESAPQRLVLYREEALVAQTSTMTFVEAPAMSRRLAALVPPEEDTSALSQLVYYRSRDPILHEPPLIPEPRELEGLPPPPHTLGPLTHETYYICPEWYTAPADNNFGEDYGLNDDGWRARGARVRVWQSGTKLFDGWLNRYGCTVVYGGGSSGLLIWFTGESRFESGGGYISLRYISNNSTQLLPTSASIEDPQHNAVYRPELWYRDPVGMLGYAIQERFSGGVSGVWFYLRKDGCGGDPDKGSCSTFLNGDDILYISPGQWRRKFIVGHEYGHKILSFAANYKNDCTFLGGGHGMNSLEYGSCAAMEGWAHFVAADIWNEGHAGSDNPGAVFPYWDGANTVYDVEGGGADQRRCYDLFYSDWLCDGYGVELDWLRQWWDFHTNDLPTDPGFKPSHAWFYELVDDVSWENGYFEISKAIEGQLSGGMLWRWRSYGCWNGIQYDNC
ncbi:MAG: GEVED domain-containing protein [Candidatus Promineifilaceae bacterium]|nr:GEVED domain-containing protein [Candidatus Promineifilaceae bacterium]